MKQINFSEEEINLLSNYSDIELIEFSNALNDFILENIADHFKPENMYIHEGSFSDRMTNFGKTRLLERLKNAKSKISKKLDDYKDLELVGDYFKQTEKGLHNDYRFLNKKESEIRVRDFLRPTCKNKLSRKKVNFEIYGNVFKLAEQKNISPQDAVKLMKERGALPNKKGITFETIEKNAKAWR